jgi:hypothetical protein
MTLTQSMAGSDEMMLRILCAAYGECRERDLDINDAATAAVLINGAMRFAVAMVKAHGGSETWFATLARDLFGKQTVALNQPDEPGVRRWTEAFQQTWGPSIPAAFALRDPSTPTH